MKIKLLDAKHPSFDRDHLVQLDALYEGGQAWKELVNTWVTKRFMEPSDLYSERVGLALYVGHAGGIIDLFKAFLLSEPPKAEGFEGDYAKQFLSDVNGGGMPFEKFAGEAILKALIGQRVYAWVRLPPKAEGQEFKNRAEQESAGALDARVSLLEASQVIDWEEDSAGNLVWVMVKGIERRRASIEAGRKTVHRWTYIDARVIQQWEWEGTDNKPAPADEDDARETSKVEHGMGRVPVIRMQLPKGIWAMGRLEHAVLGHTRARNEHSWALHQAANELLTVTSKAGTKPGSLGQGHYLALTRDKDGADSADYVAPTGVAFQYLQQDVQDWREEVYRVVQQMAMAADSDANRMSMSGESKSMDWKATEVLLSAYADQLRPFLVEVLKVVAGLRDLGGDVRVSGLEGYQELDLMTFLEGASLAVEAQKLSPTFRRVVAKRQVQRLAGPHVAPDVLEQIHDEIDKADLSTDVFTPSPPRGEPTE